METDVARIAASLSDSTEKEEGKKTEANDETER
jgi:hypothetical protein